MWVYCCPCSSAPSLRADTGVAELSTVHSEPCPSVSELGPQWNICLLSTKQLWYSATCVCSFSRDTAAATEESDLTVVSGYIKSEHQDIYNVWKILMHTFLMLGCSSAKMRECTAALRGRTRSMSWGHTRSWLWMEAGWAFLTNCHNDIIAS